MIRASPVKVKQMYPHQSAAAGHGVIPAVLLALGLGLNASAQLAVQDDFEGGAFAAGWGLTGGVTLSGTGGADGTAHFAALAAYSAGTGRQLGARFDSVASGGARDFNVDFCFRIQSSTNRQFHLQVSTSTSAISSGNPALSLDYQSQWAAYDGKAWQPIAGLGGVAMGAWYRARVSGQDWGTTNARWAVELSDAGGIAFTRAATNLTWYQGGGTASNCARFFVFTTVYGSNPGFDVDQVIATVTAPTSSPPAAATTDAVVNISGTYPHLAVFSDDGEIGIGAVMPWADKLWFVTYPPHQPGGSPDKLWMVDSNLTLAAHPASVGGTDANRLVHRESQQLNIGHYLIDTAGTVRALSPAVLTGRLTGSARHLADPTNKICIATMEEGLYEVDVRTLAVTELYHDMNTAAGAGEKASGLPGQHGKGLYTSQGRLVFSNNGSGGSLSTWDGTGWTVVETNKFTELTGPGGVYGNDPADDRLWALGWDARSVILRLFQDGAWTRYRLPKGSYTQDSDTGWYTEWPRIREIMDGRLLMHMHGLFYYYPKTFSAANTAGIAPICTFLKMPVDYCWWNGRLVMGRDDASTTGGNIWAGQSHSAPWFGQLRDLEDWGAPSGFGGPWMQESVAANVPSDAFLVAGFQKRVLHLKHTKAATVNFVVQHDPAGLGAWTNLATVAVPPNGYAYYLLPPALKTTWVRLVLDQDATGVTAYFHLQNPPQTPAPELFAGLASATASNALSDGIVRPQSGDARTLQFSATLVDGSGAAAPAYYEIDGAMQLRRATNATAESTLRTTYTLANAGFTLDAASVIYSNATGRFRLPRSLAAYDAAWASGWPRGVRQVVTERELFQAHGTFYELPLAASGGFRRVRPVATHRKRISDFASWRGMFVVAGVAADAPADGHVFRSDDGRAALWLGGVDDLWRLGAPSGTGGPWKDTAVAAGAASDPYLMYGYDRKVLELSHGAAQTVTFTVEVDFAADNTWSEYGRFTVLPGQTVQHAFPDGYSAHWVRLKSDTATAATATFTYGTGLPQVTGVAPQAGGGLQMAIAVPVGPDYAVETSADLVNWTPLATNRAPVDPFTWTDPAATGFPMRFYRVSAAP